MIVANFKANGNSSFIHKWHEEFIQVASKSIFSSVGVAPSHIHFYKLNKLFKETSVRLGMQNIDEEGGARTGSISAEMASEIGCSFLILGHSERRIFYMRNYIALSIVINETIDKAHKIMVGNRFGI